MALINPPDVDLVVEIVEAVNIHRDSMLNSMKELVRSKAHDETYTIKLFLQSMGGYIHVGKSEDWIEENFVQKYVFNLVAVGIEKPALLFSVSSMVNRLLLNQGWYTFDERMLTWICALGPIWMQAECAAKSIESDFEVGDAENPGKVGSETALVEYSCFAKGMRTTNKNLWIGDSGASCHMTCSLDGMTNLRDIDSPVQVGTGQAIQCTKIGDKRVCAIQSDGSMNDVVLRDCKYVPGLFTNLFSITKALEGGCCISNKGVVMTLSKGQFNLQFDKQLRTDTGVITGVEMVPRVDASHLTLEKGLNVNINKLHLLLGHACENTLRATAKHYDLNLKGNYMVCTDCALAKSRQKNVPKESVVVSTKPGERFYMDISSTKARSFGGSKYWLLVIDHFSDMCWSFFIKEKSDLADRVIDLLHMLHRDQHIPVKPKLRLDNSGENEALEARMRADPIGAVFEFTAPGSPQFAGVVERKFATLYARVRSMLNSARLSPELRNGLWAEAANFATNVENCLVTGSRTASSWSLFNETHC